MTTAERHAIRVALATADFGRSPGLRNRLRHSLSTHGWELIDTLLAAGIVTLLALGWTLL